MGQRSAALAQRILPLLSVIKLGVVDVGDETQSQVRVGMVEDQAIDSCLQPFEGRGR